jgi:hypothetical protein
MAQPQPAGDGEMNHKAEGAPHDTVDLRECGKPRYTRIVSSIGLWSTEWTIPDGRAFAGWREAVWLSPVHPPSEDDDELRRIAAQLAFAMELPQAAHILLPVQERQDRYTALLAEAFAADVPILPLCRWCYLPTGCFCDGVPGFHCGAAVCSSCDDCFGGCPQCILWIGLPALESVGGIWVAEQAPPNVAPEWLRHGSRRLGHETLAEILAGVRAGRGWVLPTSRSDLLR